MTGGNAVGLWFAAGRSMNAVPDANKLPSWLPGHKTGEQSRWHKPLGGRWDWFRAADRR